MIRKGVTPGRTKPVKYFVTVYLLGLIQTILLDHHVEVLTSDPQLLRGPADVPILGDQRPMNQILLQLGLRLFERGGWLGRTPLPGNLQVGRLDEEGVG